MRVLFIPYGGPTGNPYQRRLATELERLGIAVDTEQYSAPLGLPTLIRAVRRSYDIIHLHFPAHFLLSDNRPLSVLKTGLFFSFLGFARTRGCRIVWTVHDLFEHANRDPDFERRSKRFLTKRLCDALLVHFPSATDAVIEAYDLPRVYAEQVAVIPHGHYIEEYQNAVSRKTARERFGFSNETVFLFFGLIRPYKRIPSLIRAFSEINDSDACLVIAGNPQTDMLRETVQQTACEDDRVRLQLGFVPDDEIQYLMNAADAVVLPFEDVFTSGSAILAMSFGRAVVAPRIGGIEETVTEANKPLLYDTPSEANDSLSAALERALDADLMEIGDANVTTIADNDWQSIAEQTLMVYKRCGATTD
ncbi:glycosyltransferase family 4 protein [Halococcus sp. AFM35]|uniref:glycosyltransferase family 4 protein n=1 Tax=Halococcus sp. AFM35 TaxID=3421653 RepID=UPI003EBE16D2